MSTTPNPFRAGDNVVCHDSYSYPGRLTVGKTYRIEKVSGIFVHINGDNNEIVSCYSRRFRLAAPTHKSGAFCINTHGDPLLVSLYVALAQKYKVGVSLTIFPETTRGLFVSLNPSDSIFDKNTLYWYGDGKGDAKNYPEYNGKTDYDKIVEALETELKAAKPKPPTVNGYQAKYAYGLHDVQFGCASIDLNLLANVWAFMESSQKGNRTILSITLSSGVSLSKEQVKAILDYVAEVNNA